MLFPRNCAGAKRICNLVGKMSRGKEKRSEKQERKICETRKTASLSLEEYKKEEEERMMPKTIGSALEKRKRERM